MMRQLSVAKIGRRLLVMQSEWSHHRLGWRVHDHLLLGVLCTPLVIFHWRVGMVDHRWERKPLC
jgi:hypothetical protein